MRDVDIAAVMGVSRERARQVRRKLGKPESKFHKVQNLEFQKFLTANTGRRINESLGEIIDRFNLNPQTIIKHLKESKINYIKGEHQKKVYNFDLPNVILSEIWGVHYQTIANRRRGRAAKWNKDSQSPAFLRTIEAEKKKAEKFARTEAVTA